MAYDNMISMMIAGSHFVMAYLATQFNKDNTVLALFFLIMSVGFIPFEFGVAGVVLQEKGAPVNVINAVNAGYHAGIFILIMFVGILVAQQIYIHVVLPVKDLENPYSELNNEVFKR